MDFSLCKSSVLFQSFFCLLIIVDKHLISDFLNFIFIIFFILVKLNNTGFLVELFRMLFVHSSKITDLVLSDSICKFSLCVDFVHALHDVEFQTHRCISFALKVNLVNFGFLTNFKPLQVTQVSIDLINQTWSYLFFQKTVTRLINYVELISKVTQ